MFDVLIFFDPDLINPVSDFFSEKLILLIVSSEEVLWYIQFTNIYMNAALARKTISR